MVTDLAHHDDVRVLAEDGAQAPRESQVDAAVDLHLANAVQGVLDGILDRHDVALAVVQPGQGGIESGGLARAGRSGDQDDAVRAADHALEHLQVARRHAEVREVQPRRTPVQQTQHHPLAVLGRQGRDAHVHVQPPDAQGDPAVVRHALLGDVEPGHDLDPADKQRRQRAGRRQHLAQHPVHAETHHQAALLRLDVDVGHALADGFQQDGVDQAHDRRVVAAVQQVVYGGGVLGQSGQVFFAGGDVGGGTCGDAGLLTQQGVEPFVVHGLVANRRAAQASHLQQHGQGRRAAVQADGAVRTLLDHHAVSSREAIGQGGRLGRGFQRFGAHGRLTCIRTRTRPG